jgi:hypothetical protein
VAAVAHRVHIAGFRYELVAVTAFVGSHRHRMSNSLKRGETGKAIEELQCALADRPDHAAILSDEHFTVDGTLLEATDWLQV